MLTSDEIEREVMAYVENSGFREQFGSKSGLLQQLAEQGTERPYVLAALDRLIDRGSLTLCEGGRRVALRNIKEGSGGN